MGEREDLRWLAAAVELSRRCPPSAGAYSVGAVVVHRGVVIADGFSRESDPTVHAEEAALAKLPPGDPRLADATLYSSLEPCTVRASRPRSCTRLVLDAGLPRVVFAWREPTRFADCTGFETLTAAGVQVRELPALAGAARAANAHLA